MIESSRIDWLSRHGDRSNITQDEIREMADELWSRRHIDELAEVAKKRGLDEMPQLAKMFPKYAPA